MRDFTPFVLGLTGGIGAGKSTCSARLRAIGLPIFDADAEVAALYRMRGFIADLEAVFGPLGEDPRRGVIARLLDDPTVLDRAYTVAHPRLEAAYASFLQSHQRAPVVVIDAPLLFEKGWAERCDAVVCVMTERAERLRRALTRPGMTEERFRRADAHQVSDDVRRARSTFLLDGGQPREAMLDHLDAVLHKVADLADARLERARRGRAG